MSGPSVFDLLFMSSMEAATLAEVRPVCEGRPHGWPLLPSRAFEMLWWTSIDRPRYTQKPSQRDAADSSRGRQWEPAPRCLVPVGDAGLLSAYGGVKSLKTPG